MTRHEPVEDCSELGKAGLELLNWTTLFRMKPSGVSPGGSSCMVCFGGLTAGFTCAKIDFADVISLAHRSVKVKTAISSPFPCHGS
jgi:hypothetical protein